MLRRHVAAHTARAVAALHGYWRTVERGSVEANASDFFRRPDGLVESSQVSQWRNRLLGLFLRR